MQKDNYFLYLCCDAVSMIFNCAVFFNNKLTLSEETVMFLPLVCV